MSIIIKVAVPVPIRNIFDYLPPQDNEDRTWIPGIRVMVPFGVQIKVGIVLDTARTSKLQSSKLKRILTVLDDQPLISSDDLQLLSWASQYYHHPIGEVISSAFPTMLRKGLPAQMEQEQSWFLTEQGLSVNRDLAKRAPRQAALIEYLNIHKQGPTVAQLDGLGWNWRNTARTLSAKNLIEQRPVKLQPNPKIKYTPATFQTNEHQNHAIKIIKASSASFGVFVLDGVTGSGKTEVYFQLIRSVIDRNMQAMVLLPEISLTPQLENRFQTRFDTAIAVFHSGLNDKLRARAWMRAQSGTAPILLGTRSAVFIPLKRPGLIILDEEHDSSFKQQEKFRFSARDVAIKRAQQLNIPIVLGSATPSFETLINAEQGRYEYLNLPSRATGAQPPNIHLLDIKKKQLSQGLSAMLIRAIKETLAKREQVLIFLNRRGFAPCMICNSCGWVAQCLRCDSNLVIHIHDQHLRCHHCDFQGPIPNACILCHSKNIQALGIGTERIEEILAKIFPTASIQRVDRDSTRKKGSLDKTINAIKQGDVDILIGTQMLAKGHHFPDVTLVGVLDTDSGLFSTDFRATERLAQLIVQVSGRAGRARKPGRVILQTRHPNHPLLRVLIEKGYQQFASDAITERRCAGLPPFSYQALFRAQSNNQQNTAAFLDQIRSRAAQIEHHEITLLGPAPAPMLKRAGSYRYQLLLQSPKRKYLHDTVDQLIPFINDLPGQNKIKWSIDIDPIDLF